MASLYTHIQSNKRKSVTLIFVVLLFVITVTSFYSYTFRGDFLLPIIAAALAIPSSVIGYYSGDKIALAANRAKETSKRDAPELHNMVENLAITAGIPKPRVYIIESPALNAFATGRDPEHASVAVTSGLIEKLDRTELEGVLAHELSHIRNYDIRFATLIAIFVGFIVILSDLFFRTGFRGGSRGGDNRNNNQLQAILAIIGFVLLIVSPIAIKLIQLAASRQREYLADASGALLTRYPEGLARALEKISSGPALSTASNATAHLYIASPFKKRSIAHLFSTHPPVQDRINRLRGIR